MCVLTKNRKIWYENFISRLLDIIEFYKDFFFGFMDSLPDLLSISCPSDLIDSFLLVCSVRCSLLTDTYPVRLPFHSTASFLVLSSFCLFSSFSCLVVVAFRCFLFWKSRQISCMPEVGILGHARARSASVFLWWLQNQWLLISLLSFYGVVFVYIVTFARKKS